MFTAQAFLPTANSSPDAGHKPTVIGVSAGLITLPPVASPNIGASAYVASKMSSLKILEHLAAERSDLTVVSAHPGAIETAMMEEAGANNEMLVRARKDGFMDEESLPGHFFVWLSTPDAAFLAGKWVWANWDVEQLIERKEEITGSDLLTSVVQGWPFQP